MAQVKRTHSHQYMADPRDGFDSSYLCAMCGFTAPRRLIDGQYPELVHAGPYPHVDGSPAHVELRQVARLVNGRWIDKSF